MLAQHVSDYFNANDLSVQGSQAKITTAQIIGLLSAAVAGGNPATGSLIGGAGEKYNSELHRNQVEEADYELRKMMGEPIPQQQDDLGKVEPIEIMQGPGGGGASSFGWSLPGLSRIPVVGGASSGGSGPAKGFLEVSNAYLSSNAVKNLSNSKSIDFILRSAKPKIYNGKK
ncbi:polymorphic toxin type 43 domain-containing protein [Pseudomonas lini]